MIKLLKLSEIDSTNNFAKKLISLYPLDELNNMVICAHKQTHGRGVGNNKWLSEPYKNLTFSIIHLPHYLNLNEIFFLSKTISIALIDYLKSHNVPAYIKWPNDIIVNNKKISGILIENSIAKQKIKYSIIGIGLNINQTQFPPQINATSLALATGKNYNLSEEFNILLEKIFFWLNQLENKNFSKINKIYFENLYLLNKISLFKEKEHIFEGKIIGVDNYGRLIIDIPSQKKQKIYSQKQIQYVQKAI